LEIQNSRRPTCQCPAPLNGRPDAGNARARQLRGCPPPHGHAARHLTATLPPPPECRPRVSVEAGLISAPLELGDAIRHFSTSPDAVSLGFVSIERATPVSSSFRHSYLSSCAGPPGEARNRHPAASLSSPTAVTGESFPLCALVQSPPLAAMPHPSGRFPSVPEAREAL
jgi:hypothetical protein